MGKSAPKSPPPPDPTVVANAQAQANQQTALQNQKLNMVGSSDQYGTVNWVEDPSQPGGYRQVTSLSPQEQQTYDLSKGAQNAALGVAGQQVGRVGQALGQTLDTSGLPALSGGVQSPQLQAAFNQGQAVQGQVGGDLNAARQQAQDAAYAQMTSRLDPQIQREQAALETKLANQGLSANSAAYGNQQQQFNMGKNDAYDQARRSSISVGEQAAQDLFNRQLAQGQFANQAAGQQFNQGLGAAEFGNQAALQGAQFGLQNAQFGNAARNQGLQERAYIQNQPINQLSALLGLGQVGGPQGIGYTPSQAAGTDVLGAYALNNSAAQANAQRQAQANSGLMGGLFSLGSAALMGSDRRLKRDMSRVGERPDGLGVWRFRYKDRPEWFVGAMADEVKALYPHAVFRRADGMHVVNYGAL